MLLSCIAEKVTALIVRETPQSRQVLLFRHPSAGIQIPAGTLEEGEEPEAAALREGREESGLSALAVVRHLATRDSILPEGRAVLARDATVYSRPDPASWDWACIRRGVAVDMLRRAGDWVQVDFREANRFPDPEFDTFRIIGWVDESVLCTALRRHFYLLTPTAPTPDGEWAVEIDNHVYRAFWAPLGEVLATGGNVIEPQRHWLDYLRDLSDATPLQPGSGHPLS